MKREGIPAKTKRVHRNDQKRKTNRSSRRCCCIDKCIIMLQFLDLPHSLSPPAAVCWNYPEFSKWAHQEWSFCSISLPAVVQRLSSSTTTTRWAKPFPKEVYITVYVDTLLPLPCCCCCCCFYNEGKRRSWSQPSKQAIKDHYYYL